MKTKLVVTSATAATMALALVVLPVSAFAAFGYLGEWGTTGSGPGQFEAPVDVAADAAGNVYVVDNVLNSVQKFNSAGQFQTAFGKPSGEPCTKSGQPPPAGILCVPNGVSTHTSGSATQVFVMNTYGGSIERYSSTGDFQTGWGNLYCSQGKKPKKPWFCYPSRVNASSAGYVYGSDATAAIQVFDTGGHGKGSWDGPLCPLSCMNHGLATDANQVLYVTDTYWSLVAATEGNPKGAGGDVLNLGIWGGAGSATSKFGDNAAQPGPQGIATGPDGSVYVADNVNDRVQVFQGDGQNLGEFVTAFGETGSGPGQFQNPQGVAVDAAGNVYVADTGNDRIQKFAQLAPTPPEPPQPVTPTPTPVTPNATAPQLVGLTLNNNRLRSRGLKHPRRRRGVPSRTTIYYVLSEPATVTLTFSRITSKGKRRRLGRRTQTGGTGINRRGFGGRVAGKFLRPGRYVLSAQATDASGERSSTLSTRFRMVR